MRRRLSRIFEEEPNVNLALRKKSGSLFRDYVVMNPLTPFAEKKASHRRCIIDGVKTS
jgi:hypothetical protein